MKNELEELYARAENLFQRYQDGELRDYLLSLAQTLQMADAMYHHCGYLVMHVRATIAHPSRPAHLQNAIELAQQFLRKYEDRKTQ